MLSAYVDLGSHGDWPQLSLFRYLRHSAALLMQTIKPETREVVKTLRET